MKKGLLLKLLPHLIAVGIFLIVAVVYCSPALQGKVVSQHDVTQWKGSIHNSEIYKEAHGKYPLWTNGMFSGMPAFQIGFDANNKIPWIIHSILSLGLPRPIQFFFLACICFYFLCIVLRVNPYIGIFGALSFAYATYNPIIISVGHDTKMWCIAYMPALLGSILMIYDRRYWLGAGLTALFTSVLIALNHPQIAYYLFIAIAIMTIFFIVRWIRQNDMGHLLKAIGITLFAGMTGVMVNAVTLMSTYEYQKETIRGGASVLSKNTETDSKTGLDKEYAFSYSMEIAEPLVMLVPRMFGGSSDKQEVAQEKSKTIEALGSLPQELQQQLPLTYYWGGIGITSGPPYMGAIICFLAILGMFVLDGKHKWWMFTAIIVAIMMSWGSYFDSFNSILYHYLPLYNKFRAPSMILVIPQLLLPALAVLALHKLSVTDRKVIWPSLKNGLIATGAVIVLLFLVYMSSSFLGERDNALLKQVSEAKQPQLTQAVDSFYDGLKADRKSLMLGDIFRTIGFIAAGFALIYLMLRRTISPLTTFILFSIVGLIDLMGVNSKYLNKDNYQEAEENAAVFQRTPADEQILADKNYFRVFNVAGNAFAEAVTSYHYNSIGGYHAVKLRLYQDLIENQLSKQQINLPVFNMLNTKYFIQKDQNGLTQNFQLNDSAAGPAWFVQNIVYVKDAAAEMSALDNFNPKQTAFIQEAFRNRTGTNKTSFGTAGNIQFVKNDNDVITYKSANTEDGFAVFSEVYYDKGWKAFVDGKEVPIVKTDYVLRGITIPAGTHEIVFRFEPPAYATGRTLTTIFSILLLLVMAFGIFMEWRSRRVVDKSA